MYYVWYSDNRVGEIYLVYLYYDVFHPERYIFYIFVKIKIYIDIDRLIRLILHIFFFNIVSHIPDFFNVIIYALTYIHFDFRDIQTFLINYFLDSFYNELLSYNNDINRI